MVKACNCNCDFHSGGSLCCQGATAFCDTANEEERSNSPSLAKGTLGSNLDTSLFTIFLVWKKGSSWAHQREKPPSGQDEWLGAGLFSFSNALNPGQRSWRLTRREGEEPSLSQMKPGLASSLGPDCQALPYPHSTPFMSSYGLERKA